MNIQIGEKIRELRKKQNISQDVLAQYLNVSFQAVSKWEQGQTMPDIELVPSIAAFFDVSTDELFDYNRLETEKKVEEICEKAFRVRTEFPEKAEAILREGLKQFPGNEILLNNLLYVIRTPERSQEVIRLCTALAQSAKQDDVRLDALRILAETHHEAGHQELVISTLEKIPEIYFTRLELKARLLEGKDSVDAARAQMVVSLEHLLSMLILSERRLRDENPHQAEGYHCIALEIAGAFKAHDPQIFDACFFSNDVKTLLKEA